MDLAQRARFSRIQAGDVEQQPLWARRIGDDAVDSRQRAPAHVQVSSLVEWNY